MTEEIEKREKQAAKNSYERGRLDMLEEIIEKGKEEGWMVEGLERKLERMA